MHRPPLSTPTDDHRIHYKRQTLIDRITYTDRHTCFFFRARFQILQHMFSKRLLRSLVFLIATTLIHVLYRSASSKLLITSSTKYFVGLKARPGTRGTTSENKDSDWGEMAEDGPPASIIASKYPLIHSFPAITLESWKFASSFLWTLEFNTVAEI